MHQFIKPINVHLLRRYVIGHLKQPLFEEISYGRFWINKDRKLAFVATSKDS